MASRLWSSSLTLSREALSRWARTSSYSRIRSISSSLLVFMRIWPTFQWLLSVSHRIHLFSMRQPKLRPTSSLKRQKSGQPICQQRASQPATCQRANSWSKRSSLIWSRKTTKLKLAKNMASIRNSILGFPHRVRTICSAQDQFSKCQPTFQCAN